MSKSLTFISAAGCQLIVLSHPPKKAGWQNNEQMNTQSTVWRNVYPTATSAENKRRISSVDIEINSYFFDIKTKVFNRKTICKCCVRGFVATSLWFYLVGIKHRGEMLNDGVQTQARTEHIVYVLTLKQMYLLVDDTRWSSGIRSSSHCMNFRTNASVTSQHTQANTNTPRIHNGMALSRAFLRFQHFLDEKKRTRTRTREIVCILADNNLCRWCCLWCHKIICYACIYTICTTRICLLFAECFHFLFVLLPQCSSLPWQTSEMNAARKHRWVRRFGAKLFLLCMKNAHTFLSDM